MSTFSLQTVVSAPLELDSDCMEPRAAGPHEPGFQARSLGHAGSGGLGMALEEELAMLTGDRDDQEELPDQETPSPGQNADLLSLFRQKEKDLVLAAKLGKALLERNQDLTKQYEKMHKDLNEKLEHLEQEKHELRRRLERREGEWEGGVAELEADVQQLQGELDQNQLQLREAERDKSTAIRELSNQNHRLLEQLSRAAEVERQLSTQVNSLRDDFREQSLSSSEHTTRLESLQAEIKMLAERKMELERRLHAMLEENELLQSSVDELRERTMLLERHSHHKDLQLRQSHAELQEAQLSHRQLSVRLQQLTEEQSLLPPSSSLLCEIEQSMEQEEQEQEREQLRLQLWEAYSEVRSLCSHLRGNDLTDSALSTDSSMDESSETSSAKDVPTGSLHTGLLELRRLTQNLLDGNESTGSRRSDEEAVEEVRRLGEELREVRDLYEEEQHKTHSNQEEVLQLHNQVALLSVEMLSLREDNDRIRTMSEVREPSEQLQTAIRDRDDAIAKKKAVEMELAKCRIDIMSLNSQLLDAIQQKLNLSQQLEAWQDDMHRVIDQQLMDKYQDEWRPPPLGVGAPPPAPRHQGAPIASPTVTGDFSLFSKRAEGEDIKDDEERQEVTSQGVKTAKDRQRHTEVL
ncbi:BICD family-like cargo adapter 1 isoform X2 [Gymnodraco acuticeps]|uniref:BICD family-like cargo adapter 1 isoform X2 n=1 Tax=Gymnodraco acuticeps TaxID=8218 RepID=A0A6P8VN34_GYMAC|nr:BICD family-like cargo adapter 1 isoform X2 [Gymnodraco acuticeps]